MTIKFIYSFSKIVAFMLLAALVMTFSPQRCLAGLYSGTLTASGGGITATDGWKAYDYDGNGIVESSEDTKLEWEIKPSADGTYYVYRYEFSTASGGGALSHFVLQVSLDFDVEDVVNDFENLTSYPIEGDDPKTYDNPYGWDFFGIKFDTDGTDDVTVLTFNSRRNPMPGNFFAKDGVGYNPGSETKVMAYAWNTDENSVGVPDTSYIPVPGAVLLGILGLGVAGWKLRKYE